jgi:hypothetical protein
MRNSDVDTDHQDHPPPLELVPLLAEEIPLQIGLLQDFYRERIGAMPSLKDEPFDPNLPPMNNMGLIQPPKPAPAVKRKPGDGGEEAVKKIKRVA